MRVAFFPLLWAAVAGAQVAEVKEAPAPPTPPPVLVRESAPTSQRMAQSQGIGALTTEYSIGQPTDEEQYYLELINRARAAPGAEGLRMATTTNPEVLGAYSYFGVNLTTMQAEFNLLPVRPPLAMNQNLVEAARAHSQDMFDHAFQGHDSTNGDDLGDRALDAGYNFSSLGENVFSHSTSVFHGHAGFQVDWGGNDGTGMQTGRGHRMSIHGNFREVGVGMVKGTKTIGDTTVGPQLVTQDFGTRQTNTPLVTGVAYYDLNGNSFYDMGEGIGGVTVTVNGSTFHAVTANSGGYTVPVPDVNTTRAVTFTGLGFNAGGNAVIAGSANAKVDLTPAYAPPTVTGPAVASTAGSTAYDFTAVNGAVGYEWRRATAAAAATDAASNLSRVAVVKTGSYNSVVSGAYHLGHGIPGQDQTITYNQPFRVGAGASVNFQSRLRTSGLSQTARVQVSTNDGMSWEDVYQQAIGGSEGSFVARSAPLIGYEGREIRLRFLYSITSGSYTPASDTVGWFIDSVSFVNVTEISNAVIAATPGATSFEFTPPATLDYVLAVRPVLTGGRTLPFGPLLNVTGFNGPPPPAEVAVAQPVDNALVDGLSIIDYGSVALGLPSVRTFTVTNQGGEALTGLAVSIDGANGAEFVAGALGSVSLAGGQSLTFTVTCTPGAPGARTATLHLASNDSDENPFDVTLNVTGVANPEITMQQPGGNGLTDGSATVAFGTATLGVPVVRTFTVINDGNADLTGLAVSVEGAQAGDFVAGNPGLATLTPGQQTTFDVTFTPTVAGARVALLKVASNDANENPFDVNLTGTGSAQPVVSAPTPSAVMRVAGGAQVQFTVTAAPLPVTYQWRKNGASITNATNAVLTINAPKLTDGGAYTVLVKRGALFTISPVAQLGVVETFPKKTIVVAAAASATMTVNATGNGLTYEWRRVIGGNPAAALPAEARFKGASTKSLTVAPATAADSGEYFCVVGGPSPGVPVAGGSTDLKVFDSAPIITAFDPPSGIVSGVYSYQVVMDSDPSKTATSYTATGLPAGLKIDAKSGLISGKPTKAGPATIVITASNSKGKTVPPASKTITIAPFPNDVAGSYVGLVHRAAINGNLGGRIDYTITPIGGVTGSITLGTVKHTFAGSLNIDVDQSPGGDPPEMTTSIKRSGSQSPLDLTLEVDRGNHLAIGMVSANGQDAGIDSWRQYWHATTRPAAAYAGYYTTALKPDGGAPPDSPKGEGYASFTVAKDGKLTITGKTPDGETFTCGSFIGSQAQFLLFTPLYATATKGSLYGPISILPGALADDPKDNVLTGGPDWLRPLNPAITARTYKAGFGPIALEAHGGFYQGGAGKVVLGIAAGTDNAELLFSEGDVGLSASDADVTIDLLANNKIVLPATGVDNAAGAKLTVAPATGLMTGSFILTDPDPLKAPPAKVNRAVTFQGMVVYDGAEQRGRGYFLLPQLADPGPPVIPATATTILSGKVLLKSLP